MMPAKRPSATSINQDRLTQLRDQGEDSEVLLMRLALTENEGMRKTLAEMAKAPRCYPEILPTQASGRWSTKNPALVSFPREFWRDHKGIIHPDKNEWWLEWDWSGIEARIFTAYTGDEEDVMLFQLGKDIHTFTCSKYLFEWAPNLRVDSPLNGYNLPTDWQGGTDERRVRAKNFRYGPYQYGTGVQAVLGMPGIEKLGLDRVVLIRRATRFLAARPKAQAWKQATWQTCQEQKVARTFMGRRRLLFGNPTERAKDGLNHIIQGSVADLMAWCLIAIMKQWPQASLIMNKHDGATVTFPKSLDPHAIQAQVKALVEKEWEVGQGVKMNFPATWEMTYG